MTVYAAPRHVVIWIDDHQAIVLTFEADRYDRSVAHRPGGGWAQDCIDAQRYPMVQQYYDALLSHLEPVDEILILGPGQAKHELCQQIDQCRGLRGRVVGLRQASTLAQVELVLPTGEAWSSESEIPA